MSNPAVDAPTNSAEPQARGRRAWAGRFAVRFLTIYAVAYMIPFPLGFPGTERVAEAISAVKLTLVAAVARALGIALPAEVRSSSDGLASWLQVAVLATIAVCGAAAVVTFERRRPRDATWSALLVVVLRYFVASSMLVYGSVKVLKSQFPALQPSDLQTTYGDSSPMGLLWRMMGLSTGYSIFTGAIEVLGALLLFWRRTTLLGALLLSVALTQVVALNFAFDVPVKLGSLHLFVFTLCILAPHARRLGAFLLGAATEAHVDAGLFGDAGPRARKVLVAVKMVVVVFAVSVVTYEAHEAFRTWGDGKPAQPLVALYEVTDMQIEGEPQCSERWHRVTIDRAGFVVYGAQGARQSFAIEYDSAARSLAIASGDDQLASPPGSVDEHPEAFELAGKLGGRPTTVRVRRVPPEEVTLTSRGFHWVTEVAAWR